MLYYTANEKASMMRVAYRLHDGPPMVGDSRFVPFTDELKEMHGHAEDPKKAWTAFTKSVSSELGKSHANLPGIWNDATWSLDHKKYKPEGTMITRLS